MKRFLTKLIVSLALIWTLIVPAMSYANPYSDYRGTDYSSWHAWNTRHHHHHYRPYRHYNYYYRYGYSPYYYSYDPYYYPYYYSYPGFSLYFRF